MPGLDSALDIAQQAPGRSPAAGRTLVYPKADGKIYKTSSTGVEDLADNAPPRTVAPVRVVGGFQVYTLSGTQTIDGVALSVGDRVLIRGQANAYDNGIYLVAAGAWSRAPDANAAALYPRGMAVPVGPEGTAFKNKLYTQVSPTPTTLGTDPINFRVVTFVDQGGSLQGPIAQGVGHLWYDTNNKCLQGFDGATWNQLGTPRVCTSTTRPGFTGDGAVIYETDTHMSYIWASGGWQALGLVVQDESSTIEPGVSQIDFQGSGVTVTDGPTAGQVVVTVPGGGGGVQPCLVATTGDVTLSGGAPSTVDGVTLVSNSRVLVRAQNTPAQNGVYAVTTLGTGANGTWTRATDLDTAGELAAATIPVQSGIQFGGTQWSTTFKSTDTVGTTAMVWIRNGTALPTIQGAATIGTLAYGATTTGFDRHTSGVTAGTPGGNVTQGVQIDTDGMTILTAGLYHVVLTLSYGQGTVASGARRICAIGNATGQFYSQGEMVTSNASQTSIQVTGYLQLAVGDRICAWRYSDTQGNFANTSGNMVATYVGTGGASAATPDSVEWITATLTTNYTMTSTMTTLPFTTKQAGSTSMTLDGSGRIVIGKSGVYHVIAQVTFNQGAATGYVDVQLVHKRGGATLTTRDGVESGTAYGSVVVAADYDCLAGDTFEAQLAAQSNTGSLEAFQQGRQQFNAHRITAPSVVNTGTPNAIGLRASAVQALTTAVATTVNLPNIDHNLGGAFSVASNIVTVNYEGVYEVSATGTFDVGAIGRRILMIETWTGTDPGVGSGTQLAREDIYSSTASQFVSFSPADQVYLLAGAKIRLIAYQASGSTINLIVNPSARLNVVAVAVASTAPGALDTGWATLAIGGSATTGTINYCKRGNTVYMEITNLGGAGALSAGAVLSAALPSGYWPTIQIIRQGQSAGVYRGIYVDNTTGQLKVDFGFTGAGTSFWGGFSYPV